MGSPPKKRLSRSLALENKRNNAATRHDSSSISNSNSNGNGSSNGDQSSHKSQSGEGSRKSNSSSASTSAGSSGPQPATPQSEEEAAPVMMPPPPIAGDIKVDPVEAARRSAAARAYALQGSSSSQKQKQKQKQRQKSKSNPKFSKTDSVATNRAKTPPPSVSAYSYSPVINPNLINPSQTSAPVATTCTNSSSHVSNATSTSKRKNISSSTSSSRKKSRPSLPAATNLYYNHTMAYNRTTFNHTMNHTAGIIKRPQKNPPSQPNTSSFRTAPSWGGRRGSRKNSKTTSGSTINHVTSAATTLYSTVSPTRAADEWSDDCDLDENDLEYAKFVRSLITTTKPTTSITTPHYPTFPPNNTERNTVLCDDVNDAIISTPSSTTSSMKNANNTLNKLNPDIPGNSNGIEEEDDDEDEEEYKGDDDDDDDEEEEDEYDELDALHLQPLGDASNGSSDNDKNCTNFSSSGVASITPDSDVSLSYQEQNEKQQQKLTRTPKEENKAVNKDRDNDNNSLDQAIHWLGNEDPNSDAFHAALEAELGSLLEEDLEAAVSTLVYGHGQPDVGCSSTSIGEIGDVVGGLGVASTTSAVMGTPKKEIQMNVGSGNNSNTSTIVSGMVGNGSGKNNMNVGTSTPSPSSKVHGSSTLLRSGGTVASTESPATMTSATNNNVSSSSLGAVQQPPVPTEDQIAQLQTLMSQHYQILLQQAILAIRAAHGNKLQKENPAAAAAALFSGRSSSEVSGVSSSPGDKKKIAMHGKDQVPSSGIRSVCHWPRNDFFFGAESADDLAEIIDGAVGMLQDLDQNRKDAIRYDIQMQRAKKRKDMVRTSTSDSIGGRKLLPPCAPSSARSLHNCRNKSMKLNDDHVDDESGGGRMLTRSAFSRTLREREMEEGVSGTSGIKNDEHDRPDSLVRFHGSSNSSGGVLVGSAFNNTTFGVKGLARLNETFSAIDSSVNASSSIGGAATEATPDTSIGGSVVNILNALQHDDACKQLLQHARAEYNESLLPCRRNLSHILSYPGEVTGESDSSMDLNKDQEMQLRKNRNQFTAAEDNLLLRGVNLYGEKEWLLISDRFLPDRSVSIISQRYARICLLIYKANGIKVDEDGCLETPAEHPNGAEDFDEVAISKLRPVETPASYNVHRWSLEEDITLLKAVPLMGHMWAEVAARLIPHRNRGHIRKRYQVLERRVKATVRREKKSLAEQSRIKASMKAKAEKISYSAATISKKDMNKKIMPEAFPPSKLLPIPAYAKNIPHGFATLQARSHMTKVGYIHPFIPASMYMPPNQAVIAQTQRPALAKVSSVIDRPHALQIATPSAQNGITKNGNTSNNKNIPLKQNLDQKGNVPDKTLLCSEKIGSLANESGKQQGGKDGTKPTGISSTAQESKIASSTLTFPSSLPAPINEAPPIVENTNPASLSGCSKSMDVSNTADTSTRMGFEKILDGEGWSNMSSVRKLIDGNESSTVKFRVDTSNNEAKSKQIIVHPGKDMERLPNLSLDNSCSGLSMLNTSDYSSSQTEAKSESEIITKKTESIMSSVLSRAKENLPKKNEESLLKGNYHSVEPYGSSTKHTPYYRNSPNAASLSSFPVPDTPRGDGMAQGMISGPITMMASNGAGYSMDGFNFSNFSLTEESRQALDGALPRSSMTPGIGFSQSFQHIHPGAYIPNSLMEPTDLEAIDVLNQMSNSSAPFPKSSPTSKMMQKSNYNDKEKSLGDTGNSSKTSLLTKVFGSIQDKGAKKK